MHSPFVTSNELLKTATLPSLKILFVIETGVVICLALVWAGHNLCMLIDKRISRYDIVDIVQKVARFVIGYFWPNDVKRWSIIGAQYGRAPLLFSREKVLFHNS